jgi:AcrR family transcriptional regulator
MPAAISSREAVLETLTALFRERGFDGVSIADISAATGLGRPSLYHYFPGGKDEMAAAALEACARWMEPRLASLEASGDGPPQRRLRAFSRELDGYYAGGDLNCLIDVFGVGGSPERRATLKAILERWLAAFAAVARETGCTAAEARARSENALSRIEGALVLARALGRRAPFKAALGDVATVLLGEGNA